MAADDSLVHFFTAGGVSAPCGATRWETLSVLVTKLEDVTCPECRQFTDDVARLREAWRGAKRTDKVSPYQPNLNEIYGKFAYASAPMQRSANPEVRKPQVGDFVTTPHRNGVVLGVVTGVDTALNVSGFAVQGPRPAQGSLEYVANWRVPIDGDLVILRPGPRSETAVPEDLASDAVMRRLLVEVVAAGRELLEHGTVDEECLYAGRLETAIATYDEALSGRRRARRSTDEKSEEST